MYKFNEIDFYHQVIALIDHSVRSSCRCFSQKSLETVCGRYWYHVGVSTTITWRLQTLSSWPQ